MRAHAALKGINWAVVARYSAQACNSALRSSLNLARLQAARTRLLSSCAIGQRPEPASFLALGGLAHLALDRGGLVAGALPVEDGVLEDGIQALADAPQGLRHLVAVMPACPLVRLDGQQRLQQLRGGHVAHGLVSQAGRGVVLQVGDPLRGVLGGLAGLDHALVEVPGATRQRPALPILVGPPGGFGLALGVTPVVAGVDGVDAGAELLACECV